MPAESDLGGSSENLSLLEQRLSELWSSPAWVGQISLESLTQEAITLKVPNKFVRDWAKDNFLALIHSESEALLGRRLPVHFLISEQATAPSPLPVEEPPPPRRTLSQSLNTRYTFDRFVVGSDNQFAHAAALAVTRLPGRNYNPLFIYGGVGLGKTHLLNAIGLAIREAHPHARILYLSSERFINEVIQGIRFERMPEFRKKYRESCDILLMDDIQFLAGKDRTQEEFFHTFNHLYEVGSQIVVTSDKTPKEIQGLEDRLRSRFEWGLLADIKAPDLETRVAIITSKADEDGIKIPSDVALFLATHIKSNIRELEGALIRVNAYASLHHVPITIPFVKELLGNVIGAVGRQLTVEQVQRHVANYYQIKLADLIGKRRIKSLALPRQIAMYLCRKHIKSSYPELGHKFGGKDHSTVLHAVSKITRQSSSDQTLKDQLTALERQITS